MKGLRWWIIGYLVAIGIVFLAPLASPDPDGLERVAEDHGFAEQAQDAPFSIIPDYVFPGIENEAIATIVAGIIGVTVIYALVAGAAYLAYRRAARSSREAEGQAVSPQQG